MKNFADSLDDEIRAFLHIAGIELHHNAYGEPYPYMKKDGIFWTLYLPWPEQFGGMHSMEYWKEVARVAYEQIVPGN